MNLHTAAPFVTPEQTREAHELPEDSLALLLEEMLSADLLCKILPKPHEQETRFGLPPCTELATRLIVVECYSSSLACEAIGQWVDAFRASGQRCPSCKIRPVSACWSSRPI